MPGQSRDRAHSLRAGDFAGHGPVTPGCLRPAPSLHQALEKARDLGLPYLILDGTIVAAARVRGKDRQPEGPRDRPVVLRQGPSSRRERPGAVRARRRPAVGLGRAAGSTHDLTAARKHVLPQARPYLKDLPLLADSGYEGARAGVHVPVRKPARGELDPGHEPETRCCGPCATRVNAASR